MSESEITALFSILSPQIAVGVLLAHGLGFLGIRAWLKQRLLSRVGIVVTQYTPSSIKPTIGGVLLDRSFKERHVVAGVYALVAKKIISLTQTQELGKTVPAFECRYPLFALKEMHLSNWELHLKNILFQNDTVISQATARDRLVKEWLRLWKEVSKDTQEWFTVNPNTMFWRRLGWGAGVMVFYGSLGYGAGYAQTNAIPFVCIVLAGLVTAYGLNRLPFPWHYTPKGYSALAQMYGWREYYVVEHERSVFEEDAGRYPELYGWSIIFHGSRKWERKIFTLFPMKTES